MSIPHKNWRAIWARRADANPELPRFQERDLGPTRPLIKVLKALRVETPPDGYEWLGARNDNSWDY